LKTLALAPFLKPIWTFIREIYGIFLTGACLFNAKFPYVLCFLIHSLLLEMTLVAQIWKKPLQILFIYIVLITPIVIMLTL
jgi:hypothetical protein